MENFNHSDCVIVNSPSDALYFTELWSLELLSCGYLLPKWLWKTSCWTKTPNCPDSPSVWIIARISYFSFVFPFWVFGAHCYLRYRWMFCIYALISHVEDLASPHFARILLHEQVSGFILAAVLSTLFRDQLVKCTHPLVHLCCCQNKHRQAHYSQLIRIKY